MKSRTPGASDRDEGRVGPQAVASSVTSGAAFDDPEERSPVRCVGLFHEAKRPGKTPARLITSTSKETAICVPAITWPNHLPTITD